MPLPDIAGELRLGVDLVLMQVDAFAIHLHQRLNQPGMAAKRVENGRVTMNGEGGTRGSVLLQINLIALQGEQTVRFPLQDVDLFLREVIGQEQPAFILQLLQLSFIQFHRDDPFFEPLNTYPDVSAGKVERLTLPQ